MALQMKQMTSRMHKRLDPAGAAVLASTVGVTLALAALLAIGVPYANASDDSASVTSDSSALHGAVDAHFLHAFGQEIQRKAPYHRTNRGRGHHACNEPPRIRA